MAISPALPWSARLSLLPSPPSLLGDKIHLPQSALEQLLSAATLVPAPASDDPWARPAPAPELPHPLIVRLTSPTTKTHAFAVPREFSAPEGHVLISEHLRRSLGLSEEDAGLELEIIAASLPKGTKIRLRPLEAGYEEEDWKAILESHVREKFATVMEGMVMEVVGRWRFLVDQAVPSGEGVCVVDTDLEVEIVPLSEEQARETLKKRAERKTEGKLVVGTEVEGDVAAGEVVFFEVEAWEKGRALEVEVDMEAGVEGEDVDLFVITDKQHHKPRIDQHIWGDLGHKFPKRIRIAPGNIEVADAKKLVIGVATATENRSFTLLVTHDISDEQGSKPSSNDEAPSPEHKRCANCHQWIPARTMMLHESFCLRNNVVCPTCSTVFKRGTEKGHWHCEHCSTHGNSPASKAKHNATTHTPRQCPSCPYIATNFSDLAAHRTSVCPGKIILCSFCHLLLPQEGDGDGTIPDAESILSGLTRHELTCGGRTTECDLCSRRTRLRDLDLHMKTHELERLSKPLPRICSNPNCSRSPTKPHETLGLCEICFGQVFANVYDPTGSMLRGRLERKLIRQLLVGCGNPWCRNPLCKTGKKNQGLPDERMGTKEALPVVKPIVNGGGEIPLCVEEATQKKRDLAEALAAESVVEGGAKGGYPLEFCLKATEAGGGDVEAARRWLVREGVRSNERSS